MKYKCMYLETLVMNYKFKLKILEQYGSQSAFARVCGKSENWVSRIITGRQRPSKSDLVLISTNIVVKDIDALFDDHNSKG